MSTYTGKRSLDICIAVISIILLTPLMLIAYILVRITTPGPALFVQERLGFRGNTFKLLKFRTMTHRTRTNQHEIMADDPEVTFVGRWLRRFKIDELPQLFNVLYGDMSIIGPRPDLPSHLADYDDIGRMRLLARPGLTGLAQVHGNIHLSWAVRWRYDAMYVNQISFGLDLWVLYRTILVVLHGEESFVTLPQNMPDLPSYRLYTLASIIKRRFQ